MTNEQFSLTAMTIDSQYGRTLLIKSFDDSPAEPLERVALEPLAGAEAEYHEAWLQRLIMDQPTLLPIEQIEVAFAGLVPICTELPVASGHLDNLFVTPSGNLALVECKLWRNGQAKREVVGQIIDYATEVSRWSYEKLEAAIKRAAPVDKTQAGPATSLYDRVAAQHEVDETTFVDNVSRNLRLGRFLLLIVGDGIQEGLLRMGEYLQQHVGLHFTLGLVEIAFFRIPGGGLIAQPRVFARTVNIERGIVKIEDGSVVIRPSNENKHGRAGIPVAASITKEQFLEQLEQVFPGINAHLNSLAGKLADYEVTPEFGPKSIVLRWQDDNARSWNLGTVGSSGEVWVESLVMRAKETSLESAANTYIKSIAAIVPGAAAKVSGRGNLCLDGPDKKPLKIDSLVENHERIEGWLQAIDRFQQAVAKREKLYS